VQTTRARDDERAPETAPADDRFHMLVEQVRDYAIVVLDRDGRVATWNEGARRIHGFERDEIAGQHVSVLHPPYALANGWPERALRIAAQTGRLEDVGWRMRKDGSQFWANVILTALHDRDERVVGFATITRDMSETKRLETVEEAREQMNQFLAMLAHELRNPLAPIRNAIEIMRTRVGTDPALQWCREVVERQTAHLARIVDDLLDVARITQGKIRIERRPVDLAVVAAHAVESCKPRAAAHQQTIERRIDTGPVLVDGDALRLSQMLSDLLENAIEYTPARGSISVSLAVEGTRSRAARARHGHRHQRGAPPARVRPVRAG
jgi:PAS domain S-box-containing protein